MTPSETVAETKFRVVAECMTEGLMILGRDGNVMFHNPAFRRLFGIEQQENAVFRGDEMASNWQCFDNDGLSVSFQDWPITRLLRGERVENQYLHAKRTGTELTVDAVYNGTPIYDDSGEFLLGFVTLRDVGEKIRSQSKMASTDELLRIVIEAVPAAIYVKDIEGRMVLANDRVTEIIGKPRSEFIGRTDAEFLDDAGQAEAIIENDRRILSTGISEQIEEAVDFPDGTPAIWLSTKSPVRDAKGTITNLVGISVEITARKAAETELMMLNEQLVRQTAKLGAANDLLKGVLAQRARDVKELRLATNELLHMSRRVAMGDLASTIAHEITQPLAAVSMYLSGSVRMLKKDGIEGPALEALENANVQCLRAGEIIRRVSFFVSSRPSQRRAEQISVIVDDACNLALLGVPNEVVTLLVEHADPDLAVIADRLEIEQVVLNLIRNAIDAMNTANGSTIKVSTGHGAHGMVIITICDNGLGLSPDVQDHLFEPFFSTKGIKGMGVGLPVCRTIIESHGGKIWAENSAGSGAMFHFTLRQTKQESVE